MKKFLILLSLPLLFAACSSSSVADKMPAAASANINTTSTRAADQAKAEHIAAVARNWSKDGAQFVNLKLDGSFEASFEAGVTLVGKWTMSDDEKTLTLQPEKALEGKSGNATMSFTIANIDDSALSLQDANGKTLDFSAQ